MRIAKINEVAGCTECDGINWEYESTGQGPHVEVQQAEWVLAGEGWEYKLCSNHFVGKLHALKYAARDQYEYQVKHQINLRKR